MDWNLAIEKNTHALAQIVAGLWSLVGRRQAQDSLPPVGVRRTGSDAWREPMKQGDAVAEPVGVMHSPLSSSPPPIPTSRAARAHVPPHKGEAEHVPPSSRGLSKSSVAPTEPWTGSREGSSGSIQHLERQPNYKLHNGFADGLVDPVNKSRDDELFASEDDGGEKTLRGSRSKCDKHLCRCANARSPDGEQETNISPITRRILVRTLRTVEAALRRLIVLYVYVHGVKAVARKRQERRDRPLPDFASFGSGVSDRPPVFRLFDPRKPLSLLADWPKHEGEMYGASTLRQAQDEGYEHGASTLRQAQGEGFGLSSSNLSTSSSTALSTSSSSDLSTSSSSDLIRGSRPEPRVWFAHSPPSFLCLSQESMPEGVEHMLHHRRIGEDDGVGGDLLPDPTKLIRRLTALDHALQTIPQQAKRLARIMAQREYAPAGASSSPAAGNPLRGSLPSHPIRPGIPPGSNKQSNEPSHEVLRELHGLVRDWEKDAWERRCEANAEP